MFTILLDLFCLQADTYDVYVIWRYILCFHTLLVNGTAYFVGIQTVPTTAQAPGQTDGQRLASSAKAPEASTSVRQSSTTTTRTTSVVRMETTSTGSPIVSSKKTTTLLPRKLTTPCPHQNLMKDHLMLSNENIRTSSNQAEKGNIRPGGKVWTSSPNDTSPFVIVDLSDFQQAIMTEVRLLDPVNVETFTVTVEDENGATLFTSVSLHVA